MRLSDFGQLVALVKAFAVKVGAERPHSNAIEGECSMKIKGDFGGVRRTIALAVLLVLMGGTSLYAQVDTGAVLGTVKDQTGAVIPGAKVTLTNEGTNFSVVTNTGSDGSYIFTPVKIGSYGVTAEFQGFQKSTHPHVTLNVQQQVVVDRSEEHTSELQSRLHLVCRLLLEKKK